MNGCSEEQNCLKVLELVLDNEASNEEVEKYFDHIDQCWTCFENYNLEKSIRELIKTRCEQKAVPEDLAQRIRKQIQNAAGESE